MDLSSLFADDVKPAGNTRCKFGKWLDSIPDEYREALGEKIADSGIPTNALYRWLYRGGFRVCAQATVERHRKKVCGCYA